MSPTVILVTGPPGSGKTTLAHALGERVHCPVLSRDQVREGLLFGRPAVAAPGDGGMARRANQTFFDAAHLGYPTLDVDTTSGYRPDLETLVDLVL